MIDPGIAEEKDRLLTVQEAAEWLNLSVSQLNKWRQRGEGPPFVRFNKAIRYEPDAIARFISEHRLSTL